MKIMNSVIAVYKHFVTARGNYVDFNFFTYTDQKIQKVFSLDEMTCKIDGFQMDKGKVTIGFPYAKSVITYSLTNTERARSENIISELKKNQISIDDEFMESIADNIICQPIELKFADVNKDGNEDVLVLSNIRTEGARTPVRINSNIVFLFEVNDGTLQFSRVESEKGKSSENDLFSHFTEKLINEK